MSKKRMTTLLKLGSAACIMGAGAVPNLVSTIPHLAMAYGDDTPVYDNHYQVDNAATLVFEDGMNGRFFSTQSRATKFNAKIAPLMYKPEEVKGYSFEGWDIPVCDVVSDAYDSGECETRATVEDKSTGIIYYAATKEQMPTTITYVAQWEKKDGTAEEGDPTEPGDSEIDKNITDEDSKTDGTSDKKTDSDKTDKTDIKKTDTASKDDGTGNAGPISEEKTDNPEKNTEQISDLKAKSTPNTGVSLGLASHILGIAGLSGAGAWFWKKSKRE